MMVLKRFLYEVKVWVSKIPKYLEPGTYPVKKLNCGSIMTGRQLEDDNENLPNKKICTGVREEEDSLKEEATPKIRKRHVAMLLAYSGSNYFGMQKNADYKTIESELLSALQKAECIPVTALKEMQSIHFQRAARTDKGVSAAKQVVSFKIASNFNIESINSHLPEDIRVLSIKRVTKGFNCKNDCAARTYSYTLPTFALAPELHKEYPKDFRISEETLIKVNEILSKFLGTKNFHNFTSKKLYKDPSAKRFIMSFNAGEPFVTNEEFITLKVKGQSFMLHQIRKMVGYTIAILKGLAPPNFEVDVWKEEKYSIPMAPGLGLVLENLHYDRYNRKFGNDGIHVSLTWDEIEDEVDSFKKKHILSNILQREMDEKIMFNWVQTLPFHTYKFTEEKEVEEVKDEELLEETN